MKIRKANIEEAKEVQDLRYALAKYEADNLENDKLDLEWFYREEGMDNVKKFIKDKICYVAIEDEKIVGVITGEILSRQNWYKMQMGMIENLFVLQEYRKNGIGKKLVEQIEKDFEEKNITTIELHTLNNNEEAIKFYEHIGFYKYNVQMLYQKNY